MTVQDAPTTEPLHPLVRPSCVIVLDGTLAPGLAANAAAVLALTLGVRSPELVGDDVIDADRQRHPGLIPQGLPVLRAPRAELGRLRAAARAAGLDVVDFPVFGQQTTDYDEFRRHVADTPTDELEYLGIALHGERRTVRRLTGSLPLLR
jgi:hypothetical protein